MIPARPIEIIGGGLAGLSLGLALRNAGVAVTIIEAGNYPRHRVCGEFITGLGAATIARLGLAPILADALEHREVAWFIRKKLSRIQRLPAPALGISRHTLDARLADAFVAAGGQLRSQTRLMSRADEPGRVFAHGRRRGKSAWIGLKFHVRNLVLERELELHLGDQAYTGLSRIENGAVNVCGLFRRRAVKRGTPDAAESAPAAAPSRRIFRRDEEMLPYKIFLDYLRASDLEPLADRLAGADIDESSFCAVAALTFDRHATASSGIAIGDACAMIPPFTGNGMAMAFQSAEVALDPLLAYAQGKAGWLETSRKINGALRHRFRIRLASAGALHSFLLQPARQRWLAAFNRTHLLPLRPFYSVLH